METSAGAKGSDEAMSGCQMTQHAEARLEGGGGQGASAIGWYTAGANEYVHVIRGSRM